MIAWSTLEGAFATTLPAKLFQLWRCGSWRVWGTTEGALCNNTADKLFPIVMEVCNVECLWSIIWDALYYNLPDKLFPIAVEICEAIEHGALWKAPLQQHC